MAESGDLRLMPSPIATRCIEDYSVWLSRLDILHNSCHTNLKHHFQNTYATFFDSSFPLTMLQRLPCGKLLHSI
jgi:hypothetical protein